MFTSFKVGFAVQNSDIDDQHSVSAHTVTPTADAAIKKENTKSSSNVFVCAYILGGQT